MKYDLIHIRYVLDILSLYMLSLILNYNLKYNFKQVKVKLNIFELIVLKFIYILRKTLKNSCSFKLLITYYLNNRIIKIRYKYLCVYLIIFNTIS